MANISTAAGGRKGDVRPQFNLSSLASGLRCRPGDLAIITSAAFPEAIGAIVEVIKAAQFDTDGKFLWHVKSCGRKIRVIHTDTREEMLPHHDFLVWDGQLTPIKGLPADECELEDADVGLVAEVH